MRKNEERRSKQGRRKQVGRKKEEGRWTKEEGRRREGEEENEIVKLIIKWTRDDKGRNILYKKNGDERYSDFKLYKMIARTVHHCKPQDELKNQLFDCFKITRKKVAKKAKVNNIDEIPIYV